MARQRSFIRFMPLASSIITGLAFLQLNLSWLVFVGLLPFIYYALSSQNLSRKQIILDCWMAGLAFSLITLSFMLQTEPGSWTALDGIMESIVKVAVWIIAVLVYSLVFLALGWLVHLWRGDNRKLLLVALLAWPIFELIRAYLFAIFNFGPGGSLGPNWHFGTLGLAAANTPLAYISRFVGLYGLTIAVVVINLAAYRLLTKKYRSGTLMLGAVGLLAFSGWLIYRPVPSSINASAVHLNKQDSLYEWRHIATPSKDSRLLVLPEYSEFFQDKSKHETYAQRYIGPKTIIVTSRHGQGRPPTNDLIYFSKDGGFISSQPKTFLVPTGEYLPYTIQAMLKLFGQSKVIAKFERDHLLTRGASQEKAVTAHGLSVGGLVCSGVMDANAYRRLTKDGAMVLTNSASLTFLHKAGLAHVQGRYLARFHAIANARPFIQSAASGESFIMSSDGEIVKKASGQSQLIETSVKLQKRKTIYSRLPF